MTVGKGRRAVLCSDLAADVRLLGELIETEEFPERHVAQDLHLHPVALFEEPRRREVLNRLRCRKCLGFEPRQWLEASNPEGQLLGNSKGESDKPQKNSYAIGNCSH